MYKTFQKTVHGRLDKEEFNVDLKTDTKKAYIKEE
jgi:hypothetical protein